jgi:hypothetical protein
MLINGATMKFMVIKAETRESAYVDGYIQLTCRNEFGSEAPLNINPKAEFYFDRVMTLFGFRDFKWRIFTQADMEKFIGQEFMATIRRDIYRGRAFYTLAIY